MSKIIDLKGQRFGCLKVLSMAGERKFGKVVWLCKCDCGNLHKVISCNLKNGSTVSCGCVNKARVLKGNYKHGMHKSRIYNIYICMKERCFNPKATSYKDYGGRGITIFPEWLGENGFINFYKWSLANGYSDKLSIDRIDSNGNYEPNNCRLETSKTQNNNTRKNRVIYYGGQSHSVSEWAEIMGINRSTLNSRLNKGFPLQEVFENSKKTKINVG